MRKVTLNWETSTIDQLQPGDIYTQDHIIGADDRAEFANAENNEKYSTVLLHGTALRTNGADSNMEENKGVECFILRIKTEEVQ